MCVRPSQDHTPCPAYISWEERIFPGRLLGPTSFLLSLEWSQEQDISLNQLTLIVRECRVSQTGDEGGETETIVDNESGDRSAVVVVAASVRASAAFCAISLSFL